jgi:phage shock protein A
MIFASREEICNMGKKKPYFTKEKLPVRAKALKKSGKLADTTVEALVSDCLSEISSLTWTVEELRKSLQEIQTDPVVVMAPSIKEMRDKIENLEQQLRVVESQQRNDYQSYNEYH